MREIMAHYAKPVKRKMAHYAKIVVEISQRFEYSVPRSGRLINFLYAGTEAKFITRIPK